MLTLPNGCKCSAKLSSSSSEWTFSVFPSNWQKPNASLKKAWYVHYRFYDPRYCEQYPKGKLIICKGMNEYKELSQRQKATADIIRNELNNLLKWQYNPINGDFLNPKDVPNPVAAHLNGLGINDEEPLIYVLEYALKNVEVAPTTRIDLKSVLKYFTVAAADLGLDRVPVREITKRHVKLILKRCGEIKKNWSNRTYNYYKAHISILFRFLVDEEELLEDNPAEQIKLLPVIKRIRPTLTNEQRIRINEGLKQDNYRFWVMLQIFFHSGARRKELLLVRGKDVNLERQEVVYTIRKGKLREEIRPIKNVALQFWQFMMEGCAPDQYVFSEGLEPGEQPIRPEQLTRRWRRWVKDRKDEKGNPKYGENIPDWYSLKHLNTTETSDIVGTELAAKHNQHSEKVLKRHYDVKGKQRELNMLKSVNNTFAPGAIVKTN
jgi:integrase